MFSFSKANNCTSWPGLSRSTRRQFPTMRSLRGIEVEDKRLWKNRTSWRCANLVQIKIHFNYVHAIHLWYNPIMLLPKPSHKHTPSHNPTVVYFDQQTSALHAISWLKSIVFVKQLFPSISGKNVKNAKNNKKMSQKGIYQRLCVFVQLCFAFFFLYFRPLVMEKVVFVSKNWFWPVNGVQITRSLFEIHNTLLWEKTFALAKCKGLWACARVLA